MANESETLVATGSASSIQLHRDALPSQISLYDLVKEQLVLPAQNPKHKRKVNPYLLKERDRIHERISFKAMDKNWTLQEKHQLLEKNRVATKKSGYVLSSSILAMGDFIKRVVVGESDSEED